MGRPARGAAHPQIDPPGIQGGQQMKRFRNLDRLVMRQQHRTRPEADPLRVRADVASSTSGEVQASPGIS